MLNRTDASTLQDVVIRTYRHGDYHAACRLYHTGLLLGQLDAGDDTHDLRHIEQAYLSRPESHFWVAETGGQVIGTVAVIKDAPLIARVRRLRVDPAWRDTALPARLLQTAVEFCRTHGYLKVVLDTHLEPAKALRLLDGDGLLHGRSRPVAGGKQVLEFYVDLYRRPRGTERQPQDAAEPEPAIEPQIMPPQQLGHATQVVRRITWGSG